MQLFILMTNNNMIHFQKGKEKRFLTRCSANMEGDIPAFLICIQGETIVRFTLQDGVSYNLIPKENPKLRIYQQATNLNEEYKRSFYL